MSEKPSKKDGRSCEATAQTTTPSEKKEVDMNNINPTIDPQVNNSNVAAPCGGYHSTSMDNLACLTKPKGSNGFRVNEHLATLSVREYSRFHGISIAAIYEQITRREIPHLAMGEQVFLLVRRFRCHACEPTAVVWKPFGVSNE